MAGAISFVTPTSRPFLDVRKSLLIGGKFLKPRTQPTFNFTSISSMATPLQVSASSSVGSRNEAVEATASPDLVGQDDLLIVGPGVLGRLVAEQWTEEHPGCQIYGQTATTDHHEELIQLGINPSLNWSAAAKRFPYVLFCAPPSRTSDYPGDVRMAALSWNGEGSFLFTSSSSTFDCFDNGYCDEESPVVPIGRNPRVDVLLKAESVVLELGGCVVRLAGLYKEDRGAHTFWLKKGTVELRPDHILNLIHYEDAASHCVAILKKKLCGRIFLGCDNHPLTRQELMDLVNKSGKYNKTFVAFTGTCDPLGKKLNNTKTCKEIGWEPKHPSFAQFLGVAGYKAFKEMARRPIGHFFHVRKGRISTVSIFPCFRRECFNSREVARAHYELMSCICAELDPTYRQMLVDPLRERPIQLSRQATATSSLSAELKAFFQEPYSS